MFLASPTAQSMEALYVAQGRIAAPSKAAEERVSLVGLDLAALQALVTEAGFPSFRARQLYEWIYRHGAMSFDEMTSLAKEFRQWLKDHFQLGHIEISEIRGG